MPEGVTQIYDYAFLGCTKLKFIIIPPTVTYIGENVFANCENLLEIHVPETLRDKGEEIFKCNTSAEVFYYKSIEDLRKKVVEVRNAKLAKRRALNRGLRSRYKLARNGLILIDEGNLVSSSRHDISIFDKFIVNAFVSLLENSIPRSNPNSSSSEITAKSKTENALGAKKCNRSFNGVIRKNLIAEKKKK